MPDDNRKSAIVQMHLSADPQQDDRRTFICIGVPRGGTSAVGGVMQRLGIFMGDNLKNNYEDSEFIRKQPEYMKAVIAKRNQEHALWGWKFPSAANYLEHLLPSVENPHLVVVFRDLVATMKGHVRWHNHSQGFAMQEILIHQQRNLSLVERWRIPTALVSYEKAILAPTLFTHNLADFLRVQRPDEDDQLEINEFLSPGSYK